MLDTERLQVRPLSVDDAAAVRAVSGEPHPGWLEWTAATYGQLEALRQPPYGERAICLREGGRELVGMVGVVPSMGPFAQLPGFGGVIGPAARMRPEVGLYWAVAPERRGNGYATEAARAVIDHGFAELGLARIVATTERDEPGLDRGDAAAGHARRAEPAAGAALVPGGGLAGRARHGRVTPRSRNTCAWHRCCIRGRRCNVPDARPQSQIRRNSVTIIVLLPLRTRDPRYSAVETGRRNTCAWHWCCIRGSRCEPEPPTSYSKPGRGRPAATCSSTRGRCRPRAASAGRPWR